MVDTNKIVTAIDGYKQYFPEHWKDEKYKWVAIKHFQDNWDIDAPDFEKMFEQATSKANNLLTSRNVYPAGMILEFARADESATREMFRKLFDESLDLAERITAFRERSEELRQQYGNGEWKNHYQSINYISTYLWLMYPDKYYIYKYELYKKCAEYLDDSYRPKANGAAENVIGGYRMYDEIRSALLTNSEIRLMLESVLTESCYSDPKLITTTIDFGFYIARFYLDELTKTDQWLPTLEEYNPGLSADDWTLYLHSHKCLDNYKMFLAMLYDYGGTASCKQLEKCYQKDAPSLAGIATNFAKQAWKFFQCEIRTEEDGSKHYWSVPFFGKKANATEAGEYLYRFRPELKAALDQFDILQYLPQLTEVQKPLYPLNTILYGPPGTGKTYHTAIYAVAIIDNKTLDEVKQMPYDKVMQRYIELREKGQIAFTTFHQSYGYEDFIEGIRPMVTDGVEQDETNIIYKIEPGVFKAFCDSVHEAKDAKTQFTDAWEAMVESIQNNADKPYIFTRKTGNTFNATLAAPDRLRVVWNGGTYNDLTEGRAYEQWLGKFDRSQLTGGNKWVYDAIQAVIDELITKFNLPSKPTEPGSQNRVFIIDEINRGNISKIFGELITLIEPSKRSGEKESISVRLPYSHTDFSVPNNVYLLGTMNTADRSIALLDTALRRRFSFVEMMPDPHVDYLQGLTVEGLSISDMLENVNRKIEVLYDREHTIGHAYFRPLADEPATEKLAEIFRDRIIPLLQEYFYDDYEKIRLVLGDNKTNDDAEMFIVCNQQTADIANLFGNTEMDFSDCRTYKLNPDAFTNIAAYKKI